MWFLKIVRHIDISKKIPKYEISILSSDSRYFRSVALKISWPPHRSAKITDHFTCISPNVIYYMTCRKIYIGETGRRLPDCFREHLRDVEKNDTDASKPFARHFNLRNRSHHNLRAILTPREHREPQKSRTKIHSILTGSMNASHSTNLFTNSWQQISTNGKGPPHSHINLQHPTNPPFALTKG